MIKSFYYIFAILLSLSFVFAAQGQDFIAEYEESAPETSDSDEPDPARPKIFSGVKCLGKTKNGYALKRYLMIEYPWSLIQNASLEIRIIGPEAEKQPQFCNPVYFMSKFATLERIDKDIFNKKIGNPRFRNDIEYAKALFNEFGLPEPESMELATVKPVAGARADYFHMVFKNLDTNELETTLVFHDLDQWAVDKGRLALELNGKPITDAEGKKVKEIEFAKPCKIKIWLLHDDIVVWEETFQWPGSDKDKPQKSASNKSGPKIDNDDDDEDPRLAAKKMENANKSQKNEEQPDQSENDDGGADFDGFESDF